MRCGSRNSSTYFIRVSRSSVEISRTSVENAVELFERDFVLAEEREHPHLFARLCLANLVHGEPDVDQHPITDGDLLTLEQADVDPPAHAAHVHGRQIRSGGVKLDDLSGNRQAHARLLRPPFAARATMSNESSISSLSLSVPPAIETGLMP